MKSSGRRRHSRVRRRTGSAGRSVRAGADAKTQRRAGKLTVCAGIFLLAVVTRLLFPGFYAVVGDAITKTVDYRTALAILGEGISGEREFIAAVGEAFTYAFRGAPDESREHEAPGETGSGYYYDGAVEAFVDDAILIDEQVPQSDFANAVISAFMRSKEGFSYFNLPAGTTFEVPRLGIQHTSPVSGEVTSQFGFYTEPVHRTETFNHGVTIAAREGAPVTAFADGIVLAVGENAIIGKFIIIAHDDGAETRYAHLGEALVTTGQTVRMGEKIAQAGATGRTDEPGLRFELRINGYAVNPEYYI